MTVSVQDFRSAFPEFGDATVYPDAQVSGWIGQIAGFRVAFPEFASTDTYSDILVAYWLAMGNVQLGPARFGTSLALAIRLFAAHNLVLAAQAARAAQSGGSIGAAGIASSKSVGGVSVSYDTTLTANDRAGFWNATSYGQRYFGLLKAYVTGPLYAPQTTSPGRAPYGYGFRPF